MGPTSYLENIMDLCEKAIKANNALSAENKRLKARPSLLSTAWAQQLIKNSLDAQLELTDARRTIERMKKDSSIDTLYMKNDVANAKIKRLEDEVKQLKDKSATALLRCLKDEIEILPEKYCACKRKPGVRPGVYNKGKVQYCQKCHGRIRSMPERTVTEKRMFREAAEIRKQADTLKPCPNIECGCHCDPPCWEVKHSSGTLDARRCWVECRNCGIRGPRALTEQAARDAWNEMCEYPGWTMQQRIDHTLADEVRKLAGAIKRTVGERIHDDIAIVVLAEFAKDIVKIVDGESHD